MSAILEYGSSSSDCGVLPSVEGMMKVIGSLGRCEVPASWSLEEHPCFCVCPFHRRFSLFPLPSHPSFPFLLSFFLSVSFPQLCRFSARVSLKESSEAAFFLYIFIFNNNNDNLGGQIRAVVGFVPPF